MDLFPEIRTGLPPVTEDDLAAVEALTGMERKIYELIGKGLERKDVARKLFISVKTVDVHIDHAAAKLGGTGKPSERLRYHWQRVNLNDPST